MTELLTLPARSTSYDDAVERSVWIRGSLAALWSVANIATLYREFTGGAEPANVGSIFSEMAALAGTGTG